VTRTIDLEIEDATRACPCQNETVVPEDVVWMLADGLAKQRKRNKAYATDGYRCAD